MKRDYRQTNSSGHGAMNLLRGLAVMRISMGVVLASNYKWMQKGLSLLRQ